MSDRSDPASRSNEDSPSAEAVAAFLVRHPRFLDEHPELLTVLTPPEQHSGSGVVDMQRYMLERVQAEARQLQSTQGELIAASRSNLSSQTQVHAATLSLLEAAGSEHAVHTITQDFDQVLGVDTVTLCFESDDLQAAGFADVAGVHAVPTGYVDRLISIDSRILLRRESGGEAEVFGPAAALIESDALIRLDLSPVGPAGLLVLGAREADKFHPGQGTELLLFLGDVVERTLKLWLNRATS